MLGLSRITGWADSVPIEELTDELSYVVRVEAPGLEPERDIDIMVADGEVVITLNRPWTLPDPVRSEFRYGSVRRTVRLPRRADDDSVEATYDVNGILWVRAHLRRRAPIGRTVTVHAA
jgi:HSP20 family molecular chaperone IbpA